MRIRYNLAKAAAEGIRLTPLEQMEVLGIEYRDYDQSSQKGTFIFTVDNPPLNLPVYIENLSRY